MCIQKSIAFFVNYISKILTHGLRFFKMSDHSGVYICHYLVKNHLHETSKIYFKIIIKGDLKSLNDADLASSIEIFYHESGEKTPFFIFHQRNA